MKQLSLMYCLLALATMMQSCGSAPSSSNKQKEQKESHDLSNVYYTTKSTGKVEYLSYDEFVERVSDPDSQSEYWDYRGDKSAIVDFTASWCGPCQMMSPTLDKIAKDFKDKIVVYKVDIDKEPELAEMFEVEAVPTLVFFPVGGEAFYNQGVMSYSDLEEVINEELL